MILLKDVIHLYLGCECLLRGQIEKLTGISFDDQVGKTWCYFENTDASYSLLESVKPILRPLSDMTEEEMKEWVAIGDGSPGISVNFPSGGYSHTHWLASEKFLWLLFRHFDLFNLIETNQAIKKQ